MSMAGEKITTRMFSIFYYFFLVIISFASRPIFLYANSFYFLFYSIYKKKSDAHKLSFLNQYIKPGDYVVDVGANIGFYTRVFANLVGSGGKVYAFEPVLENFRFIVKNVNFLSQVEAHQSSVGSDNDHVLIYISRFNSVDHRTYRTKKRKSVLVPQVSLDNFFKSNTQKIAFIKVDVQGSEFAVLQGMSRLLAKDHPAILLELWPWGLEQAGSNVEEVLKLLNRYRYKMYLIERNKQDLPLLQLKKLDIKKNAYFDVLCTHASRPF